MTSAVQLPALLMGGSKPKADASKTDDQFQPRSLGMMHLKRTTFDEGANVRARVRFIMEGKYPVAWLDDLHKLHYHMRGPGNMQGAWQLPGGATYIGGRSLHEHVGGVKIWRVENNTYRIKFYAPRSLLPFGGEPELFAFYAEVPVADATKWNPKTWRLFGSPRHVLTFRDHVKNLFPLILATLLHQPLEAQTPRDEEVRAKWAAEPVAASVY